MKDVFDLLCSKLQVYAGFVQSLEFSRKCSNLPSNFPDLKKVWKMEIKYGKIVKSLEFFLTFFFVLVKSFSVSSIHLQGLIKKALFL